MNTPLENFRPIESVDEYFKQYNAYTIYRVFIIYSTNATRFAVFVDFNIKKKKKITNKIIIMLYLYATMQ